MLRFTMGWYRPFLIICLIFNIVLAIELIAKLYGYNFYGPEYVAHQLDLVQPALSAVEKVKQYYGVEPEPVPWKIQLMWHALAVAIFQTYKWYIIFLSAITFIYCTYYQLTNEQRTKRLRHERIMRQRELWNSMLVRSRGTTYKGDMVFHIIMNVTQLWYRIACCGKPDGIALKFFVPQEQVAVENREQLPGVEQQGGEVENNANGNVQAIHPIGPVVVRARQLDRSDKSLLNVNDAHVEGAAQINE